MKRETTNFINNILDNWLPPVLRDSKWFYGNIILRMAVGRKYKYYVEFKNKLPYLSENDINEYYTILADTFQKRDTDLNSKCIEKIKTFVNNGESLLDAAAGKGYLAEQLYSFLQGEGKITALDIVLPQKRNKNIFYIQGSLTSLPFDDKSFDTVICTHALEHIKDVDKAISELRRVCRKKLIIVIPCQREYRYTCDLHLNFYPYEFDVRKLLGNKIRIEKLDHDWFCIEDL